MAHKGTSHYSLMAKEKENIERALTQHWTLDFVINSIACSLLYLTTSIELTQVNKWHAMGLYGLEKWHCIHFMYNDSFTPCFLVKIEGPSVMR